MRPSLNLMDILCCEIWSVGLNGVIYQARHEKMEHHKTNTVEEFVWMSWVMLLRLSCPCQAADYHIFRGHPPHHGINNRRVARGRSAAGHVSINLLLCLVMNALCYSRVSAQLELPPSWRHAPHVGHRTDNRGCSNYILRTYFESA